MWGQRFSYFCFLALILFGLLFYHHYVMMVWVVILAVLPAVSFILTKLTVNKIHIGIMTDKSSVGKYVPVDIYFNVKNGFVAPIENLKLNVKNYNAFYKNNK